MESQRGVVTRLTVRILAEHLEGAAAISSCVGDERGLDSGQGGAFRS